MLWFFSELKEELGAPALGAVKLTGNVIDPPTWCEVATTTLYGGRGDPYPLWRSSLVEPGAKVTVVTCKPWWQGKKSPGKDLVAEKRYSQ